MLVAAVATAYVFGGVAVAQDTGPQLVGTQVHVSNASPDALTGDRSEVEAVNGAAELLPVPFVGRSGALVINATFDASITGNVNSAAIQAMINNAIAIYENMFNDPVTVNILFRYSTTNADGSPAGGLANSESVIYSMPWNTFTAAMVADATTTNDATADASLPGAPLSTNILPSSANGRALGFNTPPALCSNGSIGAGCPYDGIVTLVSSFPFKFTRPPSAGLYDAESATEHEIDEVMGLGSAIGFFADLRPQDLFSWSAPGTRNLTSSGSRYFSIDSGTTNIVGFNQNPGGDFGDWLSPGCPQPIPYVQNAFGCSGQAMDVAATSPEGINLDVIGYDLLVGPTPTPTGPTPTPTLSATPTPTPTATIGPLDHFTCYKTGATSGSVKFTGIPNPPGVSLDDAFGSQLVEVKKPKFLCAPTDKNGEDPTAPAHPEHLIGYQVKWPTKLLLPTNIKVTDQFNPTGLFVDAKKASHLMVPSSKSLSGPTPVPTPGAFVTDHFQCYKVSVSKNTPKFNPVLGVALGDQFGTMTVDVKKPAYLCLPVDKNGEDPTAPTDAGNLMCYKVKQTDLVKFAKLTGIFVENQFGPETLDAKKPAQLCLPALRTP